MKDSSYQKLMEKIFFTSDVAIWNWEGKNSIEKLTFSESRKGKEDEALSSTLTDDIFFILFEVKAVFKNFPLFCKHDFPSWKDFERNLQGETFSRKFSSTWTVC